MPLAQLLADRGLSVWLDQWELALGDSLRRSIEQALSEASFGVVILSPAYLCKLWPMRELDGLFSLETADRKLILPVLHNIRHDEIVHHWPMLSDRLSCSTDRGLVSVADQIAVAVHRSKSDGDIQQPPEAILVDYRRRMLAAANRHDLRRLVYELDDFLRRYPAHPQARILKDELAAALRYEERPLAREYPAAPPCRMSPLRSLFALFVVAGAVSGLLYLVYRIFRLLFGW